MEVERVALDKMDISSSECTELFIDILEMIGEDNMHNELLMIAESKGGLEFNSDDDIHSGGNCCTVGNIVCFMFGLLIMYLFQN